MIPKRKMSSDVARWSLGELGNCFWLRATALKILCREVANISTVLLKKEGKFCSTYLAYSIKRTPIQ